MPRQNLIERLTSQLHAQGHGEGAREMALGILRKQGSVEHDSETLTAHGEKRSGMTPGERAIDRQSKYTGKAPSQFSYNAKTNRATVVKPPSKEAIKRVFRSR